MNENETKIDGPDNDATLNVEQADGDVLAWEEIAPGRFMPRRVRGSCQGRVLG